MQNTTRRVLATFALRALLAAGAVGCATEPEATTRPVEPGPFTHAASCADALENPTDGACQAYHRRMTHDYDLVPTEDGSYVNPRYYADAQAERNALYPHDR